MKGILTTILLVLSLASCNNTNTANKTYNAIKNASWVIGTWQNQSEEGTVVEMWEKQNDSTLVGNSFFIIGKDTVSSEKITLEQRGDSCFYIPIVKGQNNNQPIVFTLTNANNKQLIFENPKHDFPQKITYTQIHSDSLVAEISGNVEGKHQAQQFALRKVK